MNPIAPLETWTEDWRPSGFCTGSCPVPAIHSPYCRHHKTPQFQLSYLHWWHSIIYLLWSWQQSWFSEEPHWKLYFRYIQNEWSLMVWNSIKIKPFFPFIHSKFRPRPPLYHIHVGNELTPLSTSANNLGVTFDETLSFEEHVKQVCRSSFFHLRNISRIRKCLMRNSVEVLIHTFVTSKLDYCNSLLYGLPKSLL